MKMTVELQTLELTVSLLLMNFKSFGFDRALLVRGQLSALGLLLGPGGPVAFAEVLNAAYMQIDGRIDELCCVDNLAAGAEG